MLLPFSKENYIYEMRGIVWHVDEVEFLKGCEFSWEIINELKEENNKLKEALNAQRINA